MDWGIPTGANSSLFETEWPIDYRYSSFSWIILGFFLDSNTKAVSFFFIACGIQQSLYFIIQ